MPNFSHLKVGDTTHYCTNRRWGYRSAYHEATVIKITPSGQTTADDPAVRRALKLSGRI